MPALSPARRRCFAFTLVELLVVIGVIALLIGLLLPALNKARRASQTAQCLSNIRNMAVAHTMYVAEQRGWMIDAGLAHGGAHTNEGVAWINTLQGYYKDKLLARSPIDNSTLWDTPTAGPNPEYRRTSYGVNDYLTSYSSGRKHRKITEVRRAHATVHFLVMAFTGPYATSDHTHINTWWSPFPDAIPQQAVTQVQIDAHGGSVGWDARSNYSFLDGHAQTLPFRQVYRSDIDNNFDPAHAH